MVLMYHNIASGEQQIDFAEWQPAYDVSLEQFETHLQTLRTHVSNWEHLHLTFDDGYASLARVVWPLLENARTRCTCFVTTSTLDKHGMLRREEIVALAKAGAHFGTHSHSHTFLAQLTRAQLEREVLTPQKMLADILGKEVTKLSLPGGRYDAALLEYTYACGYREIFTSIPGNEAMTVPQYPELRLWPRWVITQQTALAELEKIAREDRWFLAQHRARHRLGKFSKRMLGNRGYHMLWQNFHYLKNSFRNGRATS